MLEPLGANVESSCHCGKCNDDTLPIIAVREGHVSHIHVSHIHVSHIHVSHIRVSHIHVSHIHGTQDVVGKPFRTHDIYTTAMFTPECTPQQV